MARFVVGLTLQWVSLRYDLQWVYVGLRWVCGGGFDLRWPFGGSGCVSCLLGHVYFVNFLCILLWIVWIFLWVVDGWVMGL